MEEEGGSFGGEGEEVGAVGARGADARRGGRIVAAGVKRVALTQAKHRKQAATPGAVGLQARDSVARARRLEPAVTAEERRQDDLVAPD